MQSAKLMRAFEMSSFNSLIERESTSTAAGGCRAAAAARKESMAARCRRDV
jgi:hypothetical protein